MEILIECIKMLIVLEILKVCLFKEEEILIWNVFDR